MNRLAAMVVAVVVSASSVHAEPVAQVTRHERGAVTGVGLGFLTASLLFAGLGIGGLINAGTVTRTYNATYPSTPSAEEGSTARLLIDQNAAASTLTIVGFIGAGACLITSIILLVVDRPRDIPVSVGFAPTRSGGAFSFGMTF